MVVGERVWRAESGEHASTGAAHRRGGYSLPFLTQDMSLGYLLRESRAVDNLFLAYKSYKLCVRHVVGHCVSSKIDFAALIIGSCVLLNLETLRTYPSIRQVISFLQLLARFALGLVFFVYHASIEVMVTRLPPVPGLVGTVNFVDYTLG